MDLTDLLKEKFLIWVSKNKETFFLVILLLGNVYQYVNRVSLEKDYADSTRKLNEQIQQINKESVEYERIRSEKLEFLLTNLSKYQEDGNPERIKTQNNR